MLRRIPMNATLAATAFLAPMAWRPSILAHSEPWLAFGFALAVLLSQPPLDRSETTSRSSADRGSALAIFAGMILPQLAAGVDFARRGGRATPAALAVGLAIALSGLALRLWSIRTLGRFFTATVRVTSDQQVVTAGPYRVLRHPSYTGALMVAIGTACLLGSTLGVQLLLALAVPAYLYRMKVEEAALLRSLGLDYVDYMHRSWRLVPCIY